MSQASRQFIAGRCQTEHKCTKAMVKLEERVENGEASAYLGRWHHLQSHFYGTIGPSGSCLLEANCRALLWLNCAHLSN